MSANRHGLRMPRAELHERVVTLKEAGLTFKEIAAYLQRSMSSITDAYYDPTGDVARERKRRRKGSCVDCGADTFNSGSEPGERCACCASEHAKSDMDGRRRRSAERHGVVQWTDEAIFAALRAAAVNGVANASEYERFHDRDPAASPSRAIVITRFGKWSHAVKAAGLEMAGCAYKTRVDRTPDDGLLLALQDCAADIGRVPTYRDYEVWARRGGAPSGVSIRNRFGGWMAACDVAFPPVELARAA